MSHSDFARIDQLLQYSLLVAGEEDNPFDRQLGPIHLIKYVYLADLLYSLRRNGETYTSVHWQFYKFGPWSHEVNRRIEEALVQIRANKSEHESDYAGKEDWIRWEISNSDALRDLGNAIPVVIAAPLRKLIHQYLKDTPKLLDYVYRTPPMLGAAPNEFLDFSVVGEVEDVAIPAETKSVSNKKKKRFAEKMRELRAREFTHMSSNLVKPITNQRHDEIFEQGQHWLDSLAGEPFQESTLTARFDPEVWKSKTRRDDDIS